MGAEFVDLTLRVEPAPVGWHLDEDGWYWRRSRPRDPKIKQRSDIGFDDSTFPDRPPQMKVYVRTAALCRAIDARSLPAAIQFR